MELKDYIFLLLFPAITAVFMVSTIDLSEYISVDNGVAEHNGISYSLRDFEVVGEKIKDGAEEEEALGKWVKAEIEVKNNSDKDATLNLSSTLTPRCNRNGLSALYAGRKVEGSEMNKSLTEEFNEGVDVTGFKLDAGELVSLQFVYDWYSLAHPDCVTIEINDDVRVEFPVSGR